MFGHDSDDNHIRSIRLMIPIGLMEQQKNGKYSTWRDSEAVRWVLYGNLDQIRGRNVQVQVLSNNKYVQSVLKVGSRKEDL